MEKYAILHTIPLDFNMINLTKVKKVFIFLLIPFFCFSLIGCATTYPKDCLRLSEDSLQMRQLQMRQYETTNEREMILASAGVFQDMGFTLDDSETDLGLVVASKDRDATNAGQVAMATISAIFSGLSGSSSDSFAYIDKVQKIRASVVTRLNSEGSKIIIRVTFQRIVWNNSGNVSRMENLNDKELYQGFFDKLSKAIFLEGQKI